MWWELTPEMQAKLLKTAAAVLIPWIVRALVMRAVKRRTAEPRARYQWRKGTSYVAAIVMVVTAGRVWLQGVEAVMTVLGLVGAGLAVALNQPISNVAGWLLIMSRRPFEVGDRIQIGDTRGDVIDIGVFQFTLMEVGNWVDAEQSTGRIVHMPNAKVFTTEIANYNRGFAFIWIELPVLVTFESDWKKAKRLLTDIANDRSGDVPEVAAERMGQAENRFMVRRGKTTPIVYTSVKDSGVMLTVRMLCKPPERRNIEQQVWEDVLDAFGAESAIDFAYPTKRVFDNLSEGKKPA